MPFQRILVPFDFSALAEEGVRLAEQLADAHGAQLDILHIVEEPAFPSFFKLGAMRIYGMVPDQEKVAWTALEKRFGTPAERQDLEFHVVKGASGQEIIRFASTREVDLVVITSHGLSGLQHVAMGAVAQKVVQMAPCPVLVVKAFDPGRDQMKEASGDGQTEQPPASA
ncbi:MAG: universal stress protein [Bacteroidota bacterium]